MTDTDLCWPSSAGPLPVREADERRSRPVIQGWCIDNEYDADRPVHRPPRTPRFGREIPMSIPQLMLARQGGNGGIILARRGSPDTRQGRPSSSNSPGVQFMASQSVPACPFSSALTRDSPAPPLSRAAAIVAGRCDLIDGAASCRRSGSAEISL